MLLMDGVGVVENYRLWLVKELHDRKRRNPAYSLRSFSKSLGISAAGLSQVLSGKRPLSHKAALKIVERCAMGPDTAQSFLSSALGKSWNETLQRIDVLLPGQFEELELESFRAISDWYHYAILGLSGIEGNQSNEDWIADQLGISKKLAREAFQRLEKLGLIARRGRGFYRCRTQLSVPTQGWEPAIQRYHQQNLQKAEEALASHKAQLELYSSITMAVDESQLAKAREMIRQFRRRMSRLLESGQQERVYTLAIQLFPVSQKKRGKHAPISS